MKKSGWFGVYLVLLSTTSLGAFFFFHDRVEGKGIPRSPAFQEDQEGGDEKPFRSPSVLEPEMPFLQEEAQKKGFTLLKGGGYLFEREDGVEGVAVPGMVLLDNGLIELFACGIGGKEHESVLRLECDIHSLDSALTLAGFQRGRIKGSKRQKGRIGDRLIALVQWKNLEGGVITHRAEDLVIHAGRQTPMPRIGWVYVGRWYEANDPMSSPKNKKTYKILMAASTRSLVTTWRDESALLDNPMPDAEDDSLYYANPVPLPPPGTKVMLILRAPSDKELKEIARLEEEWNE
jgi:hypothetical protein